MAKFNQDIVQLTKDNTDFRRVILTEKHSQIVLMSVEPGDDIGEETHKVDQVLVFVAGSGEAVLDGEKSQVAANRMVVVPAGTRHNFINTGSEPLKLYTVYAPPEEPEGLVHKDKAEAEAWEKAHGH
jgi:mannose-6-phosphate isomerase-like protein (cupin superfamily)